jgi:hypothetical protein
MRKVLLSVAALAAMLMSGSFVQRADAVTIGAPSGMQSAADDMALVDRVHCVPGWPHHYPNYWRRRDGCLRGGGVVIPGRPIWRHRHYHWRRPIHFHRHIHVHRRHFHGRPHFHRRHVHIHRPHFHRHRR